MAIEVEAAWQRSLIALLRHHVAGFSLDKAAVPFTGLGIDSFAMVELRVGVERLVGHPLPDSVWLALESPADLLAAVGSLQPTRHPAPGAGDALRRDYTLNMPHMALGGLSEYWLCKELGDAHWGMITNGLGVASSELRDGQGDRLYATFTRLRFTASSPLCSFVESEPATLTGRIERAGAGMFFSEQTFAAAGATISASVMSTFAKRGAATSNMSLTKGQPAIAASCPIIDRGTMPEIGIGYRARRSVLMAEAASLPVLYEHVYDILPYHDINGVGLLYFAAYPVISDLCELTYIARGNHWARQASTVTRDVYYLANCDLDDSIVYRVHVRRDRPDGIALETSLSRTSDGRLMAYLVTQKGLRDA